MSAHPDSNTLREDFRRDGYVVIRGFLSPSEMAELWREIRRYVNEVVPKLPSDQNFYETKGQPETLKYCKDMARHDAYFRKMFESDRFVKLAETLLGGPVIGTNLSMFNKPPRIGEETPPHQDGFYFMLEPNEALTMWLALEKVDAGNGCVRYVTGSHRKPMRAHTRTKILGFSQGMVDYGTPEDKANEVAMTAEPGDLLVHHSMTIHRADPNRSNRTRHAIGAVYYLAAAKENKAAIEEYQKKLMNDLATAGKI